MKNRLQIRYHIPETLPTRAQAMLYLEEAFAVGAANVNDNKSLPGEPLVILYNDNADLSPAQSLATANVILAIGRGGDGVSRYNNQKYFVIDFAKHDEDIASLNEKVDNIFDIIAEVQATIEQMKADIKKNAEDIQAIIKQIGEKGDQCEKDTVYGYIQCAHDAIEDEVNRAMFAEQELQHAIKDEETRAIARENDLQTQIENEATRAKQAESDLQAHIDTEANARIEGDELNHDAIDAEVLRATNAEDELRNDLETEVKRAQDEELRIESRLNDEIARATAKEGELNAKIDDTNVRLSNEIDRANAAEKDLSNKIDEEKEARRVSDENLQAQITEVSHNLDIEISNRQSEDAKLEVKINDNSRRIKENQVSSAGKTIVVTGPTENGTNLEVNVDNKTIVVNESGTLSVASEALVQYDGENAINVSDVVGSTKTISLQINEHDSVLTNDAQGLLATLSLNWVHANAEGQKDEIQLIGRDGIVLSRIDVADFIKDGILDNVTLNSADKNNPYLSFTFNSAAGKETINVPVKDLVDIYNAGHGLSLDVTTFHIKIDATSEVFLSVSENGLKLTGVQSAINNAKSEVVNQINNEVATLTTAISNLTNDLHDEVNNRLQADSNIISDYKNADAELKANYEAADNVVRNEFTAADNALNDRLVVAEREIDDLQAADTAIRKELADADTKLHDEFIAADSTLRNEFTAADDVLRQEFANADKALEDAYKAADSAIRTEFSAADNAVRSEFAAEDANIRAELVDTVNALAENMRQEFAAADEVVKANYENADNILRKEFADADTIAINNLREELHAKDDELEKAYKEADAEINKNIESINNNIEVLSTTVDNNLLEAKKYTDDKLAEINSGTSLVEQELRTAISNNQKDIAKINGDVSVDGSIKDIVFDSALGMIVNTITVENATEQSLIKKFTNEGTPYVYVSNNSVDMKHNGDALNNVLDGLRNDINNTINVTEEIKTTINVLTERVNGHDNDIATINSNVELNKTNIALIQSDVAKLQTDFEALEEKITNNITNMLAAMQATITVLQNDLTATNTELQTVKGQLETTTTELNTLKANAITNIEGADNEINVVRNGNTAVVKFAEDAYFIAG